MREIFNADLQKKLTADITSKSFKIENCNCSRENGEEVATCKYNDVCRVPMCIYKAKCITSGRYYIGSTQNTIKKRFAGHLAEVKAAVEGGECSDTYAMYFSKHWRNIGVVPTRAMQRKRGRFEVLWNGNPISIMKTFQSNKCILCSKERVEILKHIWKDPKNVINQRNEIYGACKHKPHFHWFQKLETAALYSTDEPSEKVWEENDGLGDSDEMDLEESDDESDRDEAAQLQSLLDGMWCSFIAV